MRLLGKDEHPVRLAFLAALLSFTYLTILLPAGFLQAARLRSYDAYCRWRVSLCAPPKESSDLLLIAVDEESQRRLGKRWPWDRKLFADFLTKLFKAEPSAVVLDFVLSGASDPDSDRALAQAIGAGPPILLAGAAGLSAVLYKYVVLFTESIRLHQHVLTDPISGAVTERYFRLRIETDGSRQRKSGRPSSMLILQMDPISVQLQQSTWTEVQKKIQNIVEALKRHFKTQNGLVGRMGEDRLAVFLSGLDLAQAKTWAETFRDSIQPEWGHLSFGLSCTQQAITPSGGQLLLSANAAAGRSWGMENRRLEFYNPALDKLAEADAAHSGEERQPNSLEYVESEMEDRNRALEKALNDLRQAHKEMENHFLEVTKSLVMALETKDEYTAGHLERVSRYATRLAEILRLPKEEIEAIREAALLHDIGKIGLPDEVLHKVGRLTDEEIGVIRQHLAIGAKILEPMKFFKPITSLIYHHHERYDGKGYPHGLTGEFIPSGAQVIAIADSFDAMTTHRGYNKTLNVHLAGYTPH